MMVAARGVPGRSYELDDYADITAVAVTDIIWGNDGLLEVTFASSLSPEDQVAVQRRIGSAEVEQLFGEVAAVDAAVVDLADAVDNLDTGPGQTFSADPPSATEGFTEDHAWWQVVDGEVLGFWRLTGNEWVPAQVVTADALTATNALIDALQVTDLTGVTLTGTTIQTDSTGQRTVVKIDEFDRGVVEFHTGHPDASPTVPGLLFAEGLDYPTGDDRLAVALHSPVYADSTGFRASLFLATDKLAAGGRKRIAFLTADEFTVNSDLIVNGELIVPNSPVITGDKVKMGEFNANTNASAQVTITHGLDAVPINVSILGSETYGSARHDYTYDNLTTTTFRVTVRNTTGGLVSSPTRFFWQAWRA